MTEKPNNNPSPEKQPAKGVSADVAPVPLASRLESDDKSSYAGYLFGSSGSLDRPAWSDTMRGRLGIRVLSRGILGGIFYTVGGHLASKQLEGYQSFTPFAKLDRRKPLQYVARAWDVVVGKPLEFATHRLTRGDLETKARAAWEVTSFRPKMFDVPAGQPLTHKDRWGFEHELNGRGLGAEVVAVTFDFFSMSIGDALGRNIIQALDPNVKQPWMLDAHGHATTRDKGHFDAGRWARSVGRASWRIISKNAGEDWAAALPYVFQMKWQRQALAKIWPGFKLSSDNNMNGGLARLDKDGNIIGGYQLAGVTDLQLRFMGYNWYTLMYREMYDAIGRNFNRWQDNGYVVHMPKIEHPIDDILSAPGFMARYVTKSLIKSGLYMSLAVPFFWITRTPQSKVTGGFAMDHLARATEQSDESALVTKTGKERADGRDHTFRQNTAGDRVPRASLIHDIQPRPTVGHYGYQQTVDLTKISKMTPFDWGIKRGPIDSILNPFGWICYQAGGGMTRLVDAIAPGGDFVSRWMHGGHLSQAELLLAREKTLRTFTNAAISYTPYMWAKAETALRVDDRRSVENLGHMDKAIYRLIDNAFTFNFEGTKKAGRDVIYLATHYEQDVASREGGSQSVGDGSVVPRAADRPEPHSRIHTSSIERVPMQERPAPGQGADDSPRQWAETVAGRKLDAQYQPPQNTYH